MRVIRAGAFLQPHQLQQRHSLQQEQQGVILQHSLAQRQGIPHKLKAHFGIGAEEVSSKRRRTDISDTADAATVDQPHMAAAKGNDACAQCVYDEGGHSYPATATVSDTDTCC